jgi:hypothetical protein
MSAGEHDHAAEERNLNVGLALFGLALVLFGATFLAAFVYLALA